MKIHDVLVTNWQEGPDKGDSWWKGVEAKPDEPLIEIQLTMTISYREYQELIERDREAWRKT